MTRLDLIEAANEVLALWDSGRVRSAGMLDTGEIHAVFQALREAVVLNTNKAQVGWPVTLYSCGPGLHATSVDAILCGQHVRNSLDEARTAQLEEEKKRSPESEQMFEDGAGYAVWR